MAAPYYTPTPGSLVGYNPSPATGLQGFNTQGFNTAAQYALPSAASRDTAAARVRSRLAGQTNANLQQVNQQYANRGMTNSGARDRAVRDTYAAGNQALAQGLTDLELGFTQQQQEGSKILGDQAAAKGGLANQYNQNAQNYALGLGNLGQSYNQNLLGLGNLSLEQLLGQGKLANELYGIDTNAGLQGQSNQIDLAQALGLYGLVQPGFSHPWGQQFNDLFHNLLTGAGAGPQQPARPDSRELSAQLFSKRPNY